MNNLILYLLAFIFPLLYLFQTFDPTETPKFALLGFIVPFLIFNNSFSFWRGRHQLELPSNPFTPVLLFLSGLSLLSSLLSNAHLALSLSFPFGPAGLSLLFGLFLLLSSLSQEKKILFLDLTAFAAVIISLILIFNYLDNLAPNFILPSGSLLTSALFLTTLVVYLLFRLLSSGPGLPSDSEGRPKYLYLFTLILVSLAAFLLWSNLSTNQKPLLLPYRQAITVFQKSAPAGPRFLFFGVGPSQFISAFTRFKSPANNDSPLWNITFTSSSSYFLNLLTENGLLSGLLYFVLVFITVKHFRHNLPFSAALLVLLLLLFFLPAGITLLYLVFVLAAFNQNPQSSVKNWTLPRWLCLFLPLLSFLFLVVSSVTTVRHFLAEYFYKSSFDSLEQKNGTLIYNQQKNALLLNPYSDKYHLAVSQTSLALADSFAKMDNPDNNQQQNITKLAQQSIEEAKKAVTLNPDSPQAWENLSKIYGSLHKFAIGSDDWAIDAARQKIRLDPFNPNSYLSLGTLYFSLENYAEAENSFRRARDLKPDLASARFNLALALKAQEKSAEAKTELEETLRLLPPGSVDIQKVKNELNILL